MFYEIAQTALTQAIEAIAIVGLGAIFVDATIGAVIREVRSWGTPSASPAQIEETVTPAEISELAKELVTEVMPAPDAALEALEQVVEEVQPPTLAEDLGLVPPSDWGKVQQPAVRKSRSRKPATTKTRHTSRTRTTKKSA
jgi:hypothetical protein